MKITIYGQFSQLLNKKNPHLFLSDFDPNLPGAVFPPLGQQTLAQLFFSGLSPSNNLISIGDFNFKTFQRDFFISGFIS
jgi:hypothetical protein